MDHMSFQNVFTECAKSIHDIVQRSYSLVSVIETFHKNINDLNDFKHMDKASFVNLMKTEGNINTCLSDIIYTKVRTELTKAAQRQYNTFPYGLESLDMETVDRDYRHI
eukprot:873239_1